MNSSFIYRFTTTIKGHAASISVIFCPGPELDEPILAQEIHLFYEQHHQTDEIFVIGPTFLESRLKEVFQEHLESTFKGIPRKQETHLREHLHVFTFNAKGELQNLINKKAPPEYFADNYLRLGLQEIFIKRGGLIVSPGSHHFVFPSGKHCDRFLRTGNILIFSSEIYFIAFGLLSHFDPEKHKRIHCDTSSINSVAFALVNLRIWLSANTEKHATSIFSFGSYSGLYQNPNGYTQNDLLLISASTSGGLIKYIAKRHTSVPRENIILLFFLGGENEKREISDRLLCDLTHSEKNPNGIFTYKQFRRDEKCDFCEGGSHAIEISGDVFLLEKPHVKRVLLTVKDAEGYLSDFVQQFKSKNREKTVLKTNYKEDDTNSAYEVFIDYKTVLQGIKQGFYKEHHKKLNDFIDQYVPSNTKYILNLNDDASADLAEYIRSRISENYKAEKAPRVLDQGKILELQNESGAILVVGSCIASGKNLLYISRALRQFDKLKIIYFIGVARPNARSSLEFLKSNLMQGRYGKQTNSFIEVETMFCTSRSKGNPWQNERDNILSILEFLKDAEDSDWSDAIKVFEKRVDQLNQCSGKAVRGLSADLFLPKATDYSALELRKNFSFFRFEGYIDDVSQSDIYFTISWILNGLRHSSRADRKLEQAPYIRCLIDPANFTRFNDGIIQACILRACLSQELDYEKDNAASYEMLQTLEMMARHAKEDQGEALAEFLYALAFRNMTLSREHLNYFLSCVDENCKDQRMLLSFVEFIRSKRKEKEEN